MKNVEERQYEEARALTQTFNHLLITLATSLKGRMSPAEEEILGNLFQLQMELQASLTEMALTATKEASASDQLTAEDKNDNSSRKEADSIAHAQAMQYARDLVKSIRQQKEHKRRLDLTSQQLIRAEKLATVGQVAAAVAHELGNILTPLMMYAKLIYKETADDQGSEIAEYTIQITRIANRASNMLRKLVDAARGERGMMIPIDLEEVLDNILALLSPQIKRQKIRVKRQLPESIPMVMGRPDQLEQVFINIGLNAFDAMPKGGQFTIAVETGNSVSGHSAEAGFVTIRLTDTGTGIPPEHIGRLFEPFFTTKERGAGSGLGLFVSHLIVDQHGGAIEVESKLDEGTTFIVKLPTADKRE